MRWMKMTKSDIENKANEVLNKYVQKGGAYKQFDKICQSENIKYKEIVADENKFCGVFTKAPNGQKYIMTNSNINIDGRKNFTIAHELGHYFLNHQLELHVDSFVDEDCSHKNPIEYEANYFASCLLMPSVKLTKAIKSIFMGIYKREPSLPVWINHANYKTWAIACNELTKRYGVSETALRCRLSMLNVVRFIN